MEVGPARDAGGLRPCSGDGCGRRPAAVCPAWRFGADAPALGFLRMVEFLFFVCGLLLLVNLASILIAAWRLDPDGVEAPAAVGRQAVSIVIPVRGIETFSHETLARAFRLEWDEYELIFCVADRADPIVAAIEALLGILRSMAVFVPAAIGVQEGGYAALAAMFGLPPESGVAVSLLKRAREIVLGVPALLYWQSIEAAALRAARSTGTAP